jgi:hypothetical protein
MSSICISHHLDVKFCFLLQDIPDNKSASLGKLIFASIDFAEFKELCGLANESVNICHKSVPIIAKAG